MKKLRKKTFYSFIIILILTTLFSGAVNAQSITPYKDASFKHGKILKSSAGFKIIDYDEMRDVNGRDEIPITKAKKNRVTLLPNKYYSSRNVHGLRAYTAGSLIDSNFIVIFIHGAGGNRELGFNDWSFGGNFNRLKNLVVRNNGSYISPSARLNKSGANKIGKMISSLSKNNPNAKIILSCGSMGGFICWNLAKSKQVSQIINGLVFLGTAVDMPNNDIPLIDNYIPIIFAHGSLDPILPWKNLYRSFNEIKSFNANYPVKFFLYQGGIHGTPIRMIDWRKVLNWILSQK